MISNQDFYLKAVFFKENAGHRGRLPTRGMLYCFSRWFFSSQREIIISLEIVKTSFR